MAVTRTERRGGAAHKSLFFKWLGNLHSVAVVTQHHFRLDACTRHYACSGTDDYFLVVDLVDVYQYFSSLPFFVYTYVSTRKLTICIYDDTGSICKFI